MKLNISMPDEIIEKVDRKAKQLGLSRSAFLTLAASEKIMQSEVIEYMPQMLEAMKKVEGMKGNSEKLI